MREVEVKVLDIDVPAVKRRLGELGGSLVFEGYIEAVLYDYPDKSLEAQHTMLRLRTRGDLTELTVKRYGKDAIAKSAEETEVRVDDRQAAEALLASLGLLETARLPRKHRESYALDGVHVELDTFDGVPTYLELEVNDSTEIEPWLIRLGFTLKDSRPWGQRKLLAHYGKEYPASA